MKPESTTRLFKSSILPSVHEDLEGRGTVLRDLAAQIVAACTDEAARHDAERLALATREFQQVINQVPRLVGVETAALMRRLRHELLNILNRVLGYAQLLEDMAEDGVNLPLAVLQQLLEQARQCDRTIQQRMTASMTEADAPILPGRRNKAPAVPTQMVAPGTILVVEDDPDNRAMLVRALQAMGHTLFEAGDGREALDRLKERSFDLVLLDIRLPVLDGYEVLRAIRGELRRHAMPVLMISGLDEIKHTLECIEIGADDFLPKPFDHVILRSRVHALLSRRQLRVRQLEQFFPPEIARQLLDQPEVLEEGAETDISVLFCDIRAYSRISRHLAKVGGPAATIEWVSAVMEELTDCILRHAGVLVDFIGDELMAMWGAPNRQPDHATLACKTALEMFACLPGLNARWQEKLGEPMAFGIGINSGPAWVGNSGTRRKFKYGPSGDTVNLGSRIQGATKYLKASLIISEATRQKLGDRFQTRRLASIRVVNIAEPVVVHEVTEGRANWEASRASYEEALSLYENRRLDEAARALGALVARNGAAGPALALLARTVQALMEPDRWSEVYELPGK